MGGDGSGRKFINKKLTVAEAISMDINNMGFTKEPEFLEAWRQNIEISPVIGSMKWTTENDEIEIASVGYYLSGQGNSIKLTLCYSRNGQQMYEDISICSTVHNGRGQRFWFLCPLMRNNKSCLNRVSKLYLPDDADYFGCRECWELTYKSSQESGKFDSIYSQLAETIGCSPQEIKKVLKR